MPLTLANVRTSVRYHIDEPTANYWADLELNDYIGKAQMDLWRRIYQMRKDYWLSPTGFVLNTVVGQYSYTTANGVPTDIFRVESIRTTTSGYQDIKWVPANPSSDAFIDGLRTDAPVVYPFTILYALRNVNTIWVSPLPQVVLAAQVDYIQLPTEVVNDTDTFLIPDAFLDYVEYAASSMALLKGPNGDPQTWLQKAENEWKNIMVALDTQRSEQGPDVVQGVFGEDSVIY